MYLSQEAKNHTLKFGDGNTFMKTEDVPAQASQIHEMTFYICPAAHNPRLLLVGKIRIEVCNGKKDHINDKSPFKMSNELHQNPVFNPQ